ncbi:MAG: hypothetical protein R6U39_04055 [Candidatus Aegiribacteria sp.]
MTLLPLIPMLLTLGFPVHNLPPLTDAADIAVVMMEDGLLPREPWEGMTTFQREEFWTLACSGMMVQRAGWSGYVIICPRGTGEHMLGSALALASAEGAADNSALRSGLQLTPAAACSSTVILFSEDGLDPPPGRLPLRKSLWLAGGPDTMMVSSPEEGNAFFWTGHSPAGSLAPAAWRGTGSELVPAGEGAVELSFTCVHGSAPSNLMGITVEPHPLDTVYMDTWGRAFAAVDSLIASIYPRRDDSDHLLWIRGEGIGRPWRTAPSPLPPPSASYSVPRPVEPREEHPLRGFRAAAIPNAVRVHLPGRFENPAMAPVLKAVLERMIGRELYPVSGESAHFDVECDASGTVSVWLIGERGNTPDVSLESRLQDILRISVLVPPGNTLIGNAVTRASYLEGGNVDSAGVREVSMELMNILYPEDGGMARMEGTR